MIYCVMRDMENSLFVGGILYIYFLSLRVFRSMLLEIRAMGFAVVVVEMVE